MQSDLKLFGASIAQSAPLPCRTDNHTTSLQPTWFKDTQLDATHGRSLKATPTANCLIRINGTGVPCADWRHSSWLAQQCWECIAMHCSGCFPASAPSVALNGLLLLTLN